MASTNKQNGPIEYQLQSANLDTMYIATDSTFSHLKVITNSSANLFGISSYAWADATIPLKVDGKAYSFVLDGAKNPDYHSNDIENIIFNDGILHYSAFNYNGKKYIAVWLEPAEGQTIKINGNGLYDLSQLVVPNIDSYANSVQNSFSELASAVLPIVGGGLSNNWTMVAGGVGKLIADGIAADKAKGGVAPSVDSQVKTIAMYGWNAYYAKVYTTNDKKDNSTYQTGDQISDGSNGSIDTNTMVVVGAILGLGVLAVLALYFIKK